MQPNLDQSHEAGFSLVPPSGSGAVSEDFLLALLKELEPAPDKKPLQCVTYKQPLPEYLRLKEICKRWKLQYSDLLRITVRLLVPELECPSGELLELLEKNREAVIAKQEMRKRLRAKAGYANPDASPI